MASCVSHEVDSGWPSGDASHQDEVGSDEDDSDDENDDADDDDDDDDDEEECEGEIRAPLRRLSRFEYSNTLRDLLGDTTKPGNLLPAEQSGNGFGNDAEAMSTSLFLIEQYGTLGEEVALRAVADDEVLESIAPCATGVSQADEESCVRQFLAAFLPRAYRRPVDSGEQDELVGLFETVRENSADFRQALAALIEAVLQTPDFLYRLEHGDDKEQDDGYRRLSDHEIATRLSYFLWGTMPDDSLRALADDGKLSTRAQIGAAAKRMLDDPRTRETVRFFFDNYLPISSLAQLERDPERYPSYNGAVGAAMRQEIQHLIEYEVFEGAGTWASILTAPHTFVNDVLAEFYGIDGGFDAEFERVELDPEQRVGILTASGMMAGTTHANETSPVIRGSYVVQKLMCQIVPLPPEDILDMVMPPDPSDGPTARDRYAEHSENPICAGCHLRMDPTGFALENFDAVGLWRDRENGVLIDTTVEIPGLPGELEGPVELAHAVADSDETQTCFAKNWGNYALGLSLGNDDDCVRDSLEAAFIAADYDVQDFLLKLVQTDAFVLLPPREDD